MAIVFGPVLRKTGGYGYDSFVPEFGFNDGPVYRRLDDALYAQRIDSTVGIVCRTLDEFAAHMSSRTEAATC